MRYTEIPHPSELGINSVSKNITRCTEQGRLEDHHPSQTGIKTDGDAAVKMYKCAEKRRLWDATFVHSWLLAWFGNFELQVFQFRMI